MARMIDQYLRHGGRWMLGESVHIQLPVDRGEEIVATFPDARVDRDDHGNISIGGDSVEVLWRKSVEFSIRDGQVIAVDNVYRYMVDTGHFPDAGSLPVITPPFPELWTEHTIDRNKRRWYEEMLGFPVDGIACLWSTIDLYEDFGVSSTPKLLSRARTAWATESDKRMRELVYLIEDNPGTLRWHSKIAIYARSPGQDKLMGPFAVLSAYFDENGYLVKSASGERVAILTESIQKDDGIEWDNANAELYLLLLPSLVAFGFAHCKNVAMSEVEPPAKLQRATTRRGHPPMVTYKVLVIDPNKARRIGREGKPMVEGSAEHTTALHIVRGHFAWYGPGHPDGRDRGLLYGKHAGQFWVSSHVRGTAASGVVEKAYSVRPGGD
jgi:hypothetical protein